MGWTMPYEKPTNVKQYLDSVVKYENEICKVDVILSEVKGSQYNSIICKHSKDSGKEDYYFIIFAIQNGKDGFAYKDMDESMGPSYYNVSKKMINMVEKLIPTPPNDYAKSYREDIKKFHDNQDKYKNSIKNFDWKDYPVGTKLCSGSYEVEIASDVFYGRFKGRKNMVQMVRLSNGNCIDSKRIVSMFKKA